jgi:hypothetical protein
MYSTCWLDTTRVNLRTATGVAPQHGSLASRNSSSTNRFASPNLHNPFANPTPTFIALQQPSSPSTNLQPIVHQQALRLITKQSHPQTSPSTSLRQGGLKLHLEKYTSTTSQAHTRLVDPEVRQVSKFANLSGCLLMNTEGFTTRKQESRMVHHSKRAKNRGFTGRSGVWLTAPKHLLNIRQHSQETGSCSREYVSPRVFFPRLRLW